MRRFSTLILGAAGVCLASAPSISAQVSASDSAAPHALSIDDAIAIALRNNPNYLKTRVQRRAQDAQVRSAYGAFLPNVSASLNGGYQQGGSQLFQGATIGASSDVITSSYSISVGMSLSRSTFLNPKVQRANRAALESDLNGSQQDLRSTVAEQYLTVLQAEALAALQDTLVATNQVQLDLARGRAKVGLGTQLEVQQAEVNFGQQQVEQVKAKNQIEIEKARLFEQLGVKEPSSVELTSSFKVDSVTFTLNDLLDQARRQNPSLESLRSRIKSADLGVSVARSQYFPTLTVGTGFSGYTQQYRDPNYLIQQAQASTAAGRASCIRTEEVRAAVSLPNTLAQCYAIEFTDAQAAAIRSQNKTFPFGFTSSPRSFSVGLSLPIFDGFSREASVEQAVAGRVGARYDEKARELSLTSEVTQAYLTLTASVKTVALQEHTTAQAKTALSFIQDRYRAGLATFVDVSTARDTYERAENARIAAIYDYHRAFATLEHSVGRSLR